MKRSSDFYNNIEEYNKRIKNVDDLILSYVSKNNTKIEKEYSAVRIEDYKVARSTNNINSEIEIKIEDWYYKEDKTEIADSIYKINLNDKVFLFKFFDFGPGECVLAGYHIKDSFFARSFVAFLNEKMIEERYEKILNIL